MGLFYFIFSIFLLCDESVGVAITKYLNSGMDLSLSGAVYWGIGLLISWILS